MANDARAGIAMRYGGRRVTGTAAAVMTVVALTLPGLGVLLTATTEAAPAGATASSAQSWAYGAYRTVNVSGSGHNLTGGSYGFSLRAYFGIQVILNETNVSSTVHMVELQRTMALNLYADYCRPSCTNPLATNNITVHALEVGAAFINLTTQGQVYENGSATPGVGLLDTFSEVRASYSETDSVAFHSLFFSRSGSVSFSRTSNASLGIVFQPALGLYPDVLTPGESWNSTSNFSATGAYARSQHWSVTNATGVTVTGGNTSSGSATSAGTVTLQGADVGTLILADGSTSNALAFVLEGPFTAREGLLFLPMGADLFSPQSGAYGTTPAETSETAETSFLDVGAGPVHLGLLSSASTFTSAANGSSADPTMLPMVQSATTQPLGESTGPVGVQAQPETVPSAQAMTSCLQAGDCPIPSAGTTLRTTGLLLVGLAVGVIVASVYVVGRRRSTPAPPHPQARLYPAPGAASPSELVPTVPPGARQPPEPVEEEDPLGHLW